MKKYITTPIYYVNDVPHLGHAYTTVAGDVLARHYRLKGDEVKFLTGTDEHGQKVAESAAKAGMTPKEFADKNAAEFQSTFEELGVQFDSDTLFMRTTKPEHKASVDVFMKKLDDAGALYEGKYEGLYCTGCEEFKMEKDLVDGLCPIHKTKPELIQEKNWFFKLSDYKEKVRSLIESGELSVEPEARRNEVLGLIDDAPDFSVTRERVKWGIPFFKDESQIVYVWVEALQNYISALGYPNGDDFKKFWPADVHLMAKDIVKFHAIYWPAMLLAAGEKLPKKIFAHGFFTLNGAKMSKSLGNVIHPHELVEKYGADATRYLLLSQFPFGQDGDFTLSRLDDIYESHLANWYGNLASRIAALIEQSGGDVAESEFPEHTAEVQKILTPLHERFDAIDFHEVLSALHAALKYLNETISEKKPWEIDPHDPARHVLLADLKSAFLEINHGLTPFMPRITERVRAHYAQASITKLVPLFPRLSKT